MVPRRRQGGSPSDGTKQLVAKHGLRTGVPKILSHEGFVRQMGTLKSMGVTYQWPFLDMALIALMLLSFSNNNAYHQKSLG